jgi:hypothetical protein
MVKKGSEIKWKTKAKDSFQIINQAIFEAHVLISPYFEKDFMIFSFASHDTLVTKLLQKKI